jgi:hypothetical protein
MFTSLYIHIHKAKYSDRDIYMLSYQRITHVHTIAGMSQTQTVYSVILFCIYYAGMSQTQTLYMCYSVLYVLLQACRRLRLCSRALRTCTIGWDSLEVHVRTYIHIHTYTYIRMYVYIHTYMRMCSRDLRTCTIG